MVPGVLLTCTLMGLAVKYLCAYEEMEFTHALILGSIVSTTDPVSVVALLKELAAPLHIETLVEMESLFNDGVAMVFFTMFLQMAKGQESSIGTAIVGFLRQAIGGLAFG